MTEVAASIPSHDDIWGDLASAVPPAPPPGLAAPPASDDDDDGDDDDAAAVDDAELADYAAVARRRRGSGAAGGDCALVAAARRGATEAVRALLGAGAAATATSAGGESALEAATASGELGAALALVKAGASVSATDDALLRVATLVGDDELVARLLEAGEPPLACREPADGEPPLLEDDEEPGATSCLLLAARHPMARVLDAYLAHFGDAGGADAPQGSRRVTALMVAAANSGRDDARAAKRLLAAGCAPTAADADGRSALHRAARADCRACVAALADAARDTLSEAAYRAFLDGAERGTRRTALHVAAGAGAAAAAAALLRAGADATKVDAAGGTALRSAVDRGHEPCARALLEMSDAALDGDFHRCVELARNGNWPVDGRVEARRGDDVVPGPTPLAAAAARGDVDGVVALVEAGGADVTARGPESPLAVAAAHGRLEVCGELLRLGAKPARDLDDKGAQLLTFACDCRDADVVAAVLGALDAGDLGRPALRGALHMAAARGDDASVEALLAFGRTVGAGPSSPRGDCPLGGAPATPRGRGDDAGCDYLVRAASDGDDREPALLAACRAGAYACVERLTRDAGSLRAALDDERRCALHHAAARDRAHLVEYLCGADASLVSCRDARGATPLHAAAAAGAGAAIGALLRHGADATLVDARKRTPRDVALERGGKRAAAQLDAMAAAIDDGDFDECARLADAGNWPVDFRAGAGAGDTALVAAARRGAPDAVSRLLACGAAVDAPNGAPGGGETPLAAAAKAGHLDVCAALLAAGADPTRVADEAKTLLVAAVVDDEPELVDALLLKGASAKPIAGEAPAGAFLVAVELGSPHIVASFLRRAADAPDALDVDAAHGAPALTALHAAAARGRADIVDALLGAGSNVNVVDGGGRSALHHAAVHDHDDVLRVLVSNGADVKRADAAGVTPLAAAKAAGAKSAESALRMAESMLHKTP